MPLPENYSELLRDPRWQRKRLEVFKRDNFTCQDCGDDKHELHVHHLKYFSGMPPWEIPVKWLLTLCYYCHNVRHKRSKMLLKMKMQRRN